MKRHPSVFSSNLEFFMSLTAEFHLISMSLDSFVGGGSLCYFANGPFLCGIPQILRVTFQCFPQLINVTLFMKL